MLRALTLAAFLLGLAAAPAMGAQWQIDLSGSPTEMPRSDERIVYTAKVTNPEPVATPGGAVTLVIALPGGNETSVFRDVTSSGWVCSKASASGAVKASATCTRSDALGAGASYPTIQFATHLGEDAEAPVGTAEATVSGGGMQSATDTAQYTFTEIGAGFGPLENSFRVPVEGWYDAFPQAHLTYPQPPTTIVSVGSGTLELSSPSEASGPQILSAGPQPFQVGQTISGPGVPAGTTITKITPVVGAPGSTLQLSVAPAHSGVAVPISSGPVTGTATMDRTGTLTEVVTATGTATAVASSNVLTGVNTSSGAFSVGQTLVATSASYTKAGGHPLSAGTTFGLNVHKTVTDQTIPNESVKDVVVDAPRGFVGNALSTPEYCDGIEEVVLGTCPQESSVGGTDLYINPPELLVNNLYPYYVPQRLAFGGRPIFSLEPEFGRPAQFAFGIFIGFIPYTFVPEVRADEGYAISFRTAPIVLAPEIDGANVTLCNFGTNLENTGFLAGNTLSSCKASTDSDAYPHPLITNPTRCSGPPPSAALKLASWQHPADVKTVQFSQSAVTDCEDVEFTPEAVLRPTNREADTPTGLDVEFKMPLDGLLDPNGTGQAALDNATVTFPKGMSINPSSAQGLNACSLAQVKLRSNDPAECPESSRVGEIEIETPLIREPLKGSIYVAQQNHNPFDSTLGLYMVFSSARDGITVKVAGKVTPDPRTGQLVSTFTENPEWPFSRLTLRFNEGPRAPLINPPTCGSYAIHTEFSPWSAVNPANPTPNEIVSSDSSYEVVSGPSGSPCPPPSLEPKLTAGLQGVQAGSKSPFVFSLSREDGTQRFTGIEVSTPKGLTAYLKGIPYCTDAQLGSISGAEEAGRPEIANPTCPAASQVGTSEAGAGSGPFPFYTKGKAYLAGPYKGAPVSLAVVTPAVAGPFDLGNVVIRNPLYVNPVTSQVSTVSDPIPTILHGILLDVRDIRVALDRPGFTAAPTSCEPMAVNATVTGESGVTAPLSSRFQVGGCEALGFKPKLAIRLFGGTHRGSHPKLRAVLTPRPGDANIASASVTLPHSEFLDQAHIKTICTRVQFAAKACPAGSIYGFAEATTPLLDAPVSGPVYLRSSNNPLPDLVAALRGPDSQPIEVHVAGRIDSVNGGIRSTFETVPDQPVSSFTLTMQGGKKGLLVNSRDLCKGKPQRVNGAFTAQNGRTATLRPVLQNACKGKAKKAKRHR
jgi:hypothetical protein